MMYLMWSVWMWQLEFLGIEHERGPWLQEDNRFCGYVFATHLDDVFEVVLSHSNNLWKNLVNEWVPIHGYYYKWNIVFILNWPLSCWNPCSKTHSRICWPGRGWSAKTKRQVLNNSIITLLGELLVEVGEVEAASDVRDEGWLHLLVEDVLEFNACKPRMCLDFFWAFRT